jgi:hypothetical protein
VRRVTTVLLIACAFAFAFAVAGCGGGGESASDTSTATVTETTMGETTTSEATETETATDTETATETETETDTETNAAGAFASGECRELVKSGQELSQALGASSGAQSLKDSAALFQQFVDKAPSEIRADLQVLADALSKYADALKDLKPAQAPDAKTLQKLQQLATSIDQPKVEAASKRVEAWAKKNCGIGNG